MKNPILLFLSLTCATPALAVPPPAVLDADFWATPRQGEAVVARQGLAAVVRALAQEPSARLVVRHAEGEWGELWGQEMAAWLVALGVASSRIEVVPSATVEAVEVALDGVSATSMERTEDVAPPAGAGEGAVQEKE